MVPAGRVGTLSSCSFLSDQIGAKRRYRMCSCLKVHLVWVPKPRNSATRPGIVRFQVPFEDSEVARELRGPATPRNSAPYAPALSRRLGMKLSKGRRLSTLYSVSARGARGFFGDLSRLSRNGPGRPCRVAGPLWRSPLGVVLLQIFLTLPLAPAAGSCGGTHPPAPEEARGRGIEVFRR